MLDKNLFPYDLAVVAILKNEGPYLREWLDYHLAAGVEHFYLYDNDSTDNQAEVARPYVEAGLVDYFHVLGKMMQVPVYNEAIYRFRFHCRYMAFIDGDEFIFPRTGQSIVDVVDEILSRDPRAVALAINWQIYGSNGQETADYSKGVLERFTRRAPTDWAPDGKGNAHVKFIANPRRMNFLRSPHYSYYFRGFYTINENGTPTVRFVSQTVNTEKIVINHYHCKSREEYRIKRERGIATAIIGPNYSDKQFESHDRNEVFDDGILKYRDARKEKFSLESADDRLARVTKALTETLPNVDDMETALTCRALSGYLREKFPADERWRTCEEQSLAAVLKLLDKMTLAETQLFIRETTLWSLPYPIVNQIRCAMLNIIPQLKDIVHLNNLWDDYVYLNYLQDLLKLKE